MGKIEVGMIEINERRIKKVRGGFLVRQVLEFRYNWTKFSGLSSLLMRFCVFVLGLFAHCSAPNGQSQSKDMKLNKYSCFFFSGKNTIFILTMLIKLDI